MKDIDQIQLYDNLVEEEEELDEDLKQIKMKSTPIPNLSFFII